MLYYSLMLYIHYNIQVYNNEIKYLMVTIDVGVTAIKTNSMARNIQGARIFSWEQLSSQRPCFAVAAPTIQLQLW